MLKYRGSFSVSSYFVYSTIYCAISTHKLTLLAVTQFSMDFFNERDCVTIQINVAHLGHALIF